MSAIEAITPTILPAGFMDDYQLVVEAGKQLYNSATSFALTLVQVKERQGDNIYQIIAMAARDLDVSEKTLKNYLGTMEAAQKEGWYVPSLTVGHHQSVDLKCLEPGEKETLLSAAVENDLSVGALREATSVYLEEHNKITNSTRKEREKTPLEEMGERIEKADGLFRRCRDLTSGELQDDIDAWLLGK
jgi:hypothetical protein